MNLPVIEVDQSEARKRFLEYRRAVRERHSDEDAQIMRAYRELAVGGRQLLNLSEAMRLGGTVERERVLRIGGERSTSTSVLPRLAVARADAQWCWTSGVGENGAVTFQTKAELAERNRRDRVFIPAGTFENGKGWISHWSNTNWQAHVPIVPPPLRPADKLGNYHLLWEPEWKQTPVPPGDPALLKHIGGDLYAVVAIWDLTEVERAVLAGRSVEA
jgi:hypothetical protein